MPRTSSPVRSPRGTDDGAAIVEFVMITVLLVFLVFGVLQVAALFYVRNVVAASASDAARFAASANIDAAAGGVRANELIARALSPGISSGIPCTGTITTDAASGLREARVECRGRVRSIFLPAGGFISINIVAHALKEG